MGVPYANTISGLLKKRSELMGDAQRLREELAHVGNDVEALDRTLIALGYQGDLKAVQPRGNRIVFFARDELRRFLLDELRCNHLHHAYQVVDLGIIWEIIEDDLAPLEEACRKAVGSV